MHEIMTIEEVANYLRVSERTVYDWAQKGELPGGKIGTTWRFKSADIEKWVNDRLKGEKGVKAEGEKKNGNTPLVSERILILEQGSKQEVFDLLIGQLSQSDALRNADALRSGILEREKLMSTGIGFGIGVPHVRSDAVHHLVMAVAICRKGIEDYDSLDGAPVHIVCMLAARADQHAEYLRMLSGISSRLKDEAVRQQLLTSDDREDILQLLTE